MYGSRIALSAGMGIMIFVITALIAGFKLAFREARWTGSLITVVVGTLVGGAVGIATWLIA